MGNIVSKEIFDNCHDLVEKAKFTRNRTAELIGLSVSTVGRVIQCKTYDEHIEAARSGYKPLIKTRRGDKKEEQEKPLKEPVHQTITIQATHYMMEELRKTNEYLRLISNKLAFIVEELTGTGGQKSDRA